MKKTIRLTESQLRNIIDEVLSMSKDRKNDSDRMVKDYEGGQYKWFNNDYSRIKVNDLDLALKRALSQYRTIYGNNLKRVIAKDDGIPVGFLIYTLEGDPYIDNIGDGKIYPVVCSTAVNPEFRNKGILKSMIEKSGIGKPFLVHASYLSPENLWERFGCKHAKNFDDKGNKILKCE